jgi:chromosome segregation ATPase
LSEQLSESQAALHETNASKATAEHELRQQGQRVSELVDGVGELNVTLRRTEADLNDVAAQRDQLRTLLEASHGELVDAKAARQDAESSAAAKSERLKQLQAVLDDAIARRIESIQGENASLSGRVEELERKSAALAEAKSSRESELCALRDDKRAAEGNLEQMRTAVSDFNAVLTAAGSRFARTMEAELAGGSATLPASSEEKNVQARPAGDGS